MLSNEFDFGELRRNENFGVKQYKDAIFRGLLAPGPQGRQVRQGGGVQVYKNGRIYEGDWTND